LISDIKRLQWFRNQIILGPGCLTNRRKGKWKEKRPLGRQGFTCIPILTRRKFHKFDSVSWGTGWDWIGSEGDLEGDLEGGLGSGCGVGDM